MLNCVESSFSSRFRSCELNSGPVNILSHKPCGLVELYPKFVPCLVLDKMLLLFPKDQIIKLVFIVVVYVVVLVQSMVKESTLIRETKDQQITELKKMVEHSDQSTLNEFEKKVSFVPTIRGINQRNYPLFAYRRILRLRSPFSAYFACFASVEFLC